MRCCMTQKKTCNFLLRDVPIEIYRRLEELAREHRRSRMQEAIIALSNGLGMHPRSLKQPEPLQLKKKISTDFIEQAIHEGRE